MKIISKFSVILTSKYRLTQIVRIHLNIFIWVCNKNTSSSTLPVMGYFYCFVYFCDHSISRGRYAPVNLAAQIWWWVIHREVCPWGPLPHLKQNIPVLQHNIYHRYQCGQFKRPLSPPQPPPPLPTDQAAQI